MKAVRTVIALGCAALIAACSSSSTDPTPAGSRGTSGASDSGSGTSGGGTSGTGGTSGGTSGGPDAGFDGGFDLAFTGGGPDIKQTVFQVAPVRGSFCMGAGAAGKVCSFTGSVTVPSSGCTFIVNVAFVGPLTPATAFPVAVDPTTPPGKSTVNYTEVCGATTKIWKATGGTVLLDANTPPAQGLSTGAASFSVQGATMAPAPNGAGGASGTFTITGKGVNVSYSSSG